MKFSLRITRIFTILIILLSFSTIFALSKAQKLLREIKILQEKTENNAPPITRDTKATTEELFYASVDTPYAEAEISGTGNELANELGHTKSKHRELCISYTFHISINNFHKEWECKYQQYENENVVIFRFDRKNTSSSPGFMMYQTYDRDSYEYPTYALSGITVHVESISIQQKRDGKDPILTNPLYTKTKGKKREYVLSGGENIVEAIFFISGSSHCAKGNKNCWDYLNPDYQVTISIQKYNPEFPDEKIIALLEKVIDSIQPLDEWAVAKLSE